MKKFGNLLLLWTVAVFILTTSCGMVFTIAQQVLRLNANDPQTEIARQTALQIEQGQIELSQPPATEDLSRSLSLFEIIYDAKYNPIVTSVKLHDSVPQVPKDALEYAKTHGENKITWEPQAGIREAIVVVPFKGKEQGYVVVGKSLSEVEKRENTILILSIFMWFTAQLALMGFFSGWILLQKKGIITSS